MDFKLSKEQEMIKKAAQQFASKTILPLVRQLEEENKIPQEVWDGLAELGFFGLPFDEKFGGG
ncbi:MAG: acyl-CoA dehydrogenase family protein, partial [Syntrophomonadaceae bacterium]|nr:acyl-CoA dehydrogenase family protein [Syntrophomonadaceae bacterium]